jgi:hypothetical protein
MAAAKGLNAMNHAGVALGTGRGVRHPYGPRYWRRPIYVRPVRTQLTPAQRHLEKLREDLEGIAATKPATTAQKSTLSSDLMAVSEGPIKPTSDHLHQLSDHLADHLAGHQALKSHAGQLALDLKTVLNGAKLGKDDINQAIYGGQDILRTAGVGNEPIKTISKDLTDIALKVREMAQQALNR